MLRIFRVIDPDSPDRPIEIITSNRHKIVTLDTSGVDWSEFLPPGPNLDNTDLDPFSWVEEVTEHQLEELDNIKTGYERSDNQKQT